MKAFSPSLYLSFTLSTYVDIVFYKYALNMFVENSYVFMENYFCSFCLLLIQQNGFVYIY